MKTITILLALLAGSIYNKANAQFNFQRSWGTYFGDERFVFTDSAVDNAGNLYVIGTLDGSSSTNFPVFTNTTAFHPNYGGGQTDGFLVKFNPEGTLVWGTFIGGEAEEELMAIDIDRDNNIYIVGDTNSASGITTPNSYQVNYAGNHDFFIAKFNENGTILWSTYYGGTESELNTLDLASFNNFPKRVHITLDGSGYFYIAGYAGSTNLATADVFQETRGNSNQIIAKFDVLGNRIWATYFGQNTAIASLKADNSGVYVAGMTLDCPPNYTYNTYYGTTNGFKPLPDNCRELFLNKFTPNGQREWGTYYGGAATEQVSSNSIALTSDSVFLAGMAPNYLNQEVATANSYQPNCNGSSNFMAQFHKNGTRIQGTYNGNPQPLQTTGAPSNVATDEDNNYYNFGATALMDIASGDGFKTSPSNYYSLDGFVCKFDPNNNRLWGTYYGGEGAERNVRFHAYDNGTKFYIIGATNSQNAIATPNSYQTTKNCFDCDNIIPGEITNIFFTHFEPLPLAAPNFNATSVTLYPNPAKTNVSIAVNNPDNQKLNLEFYDMLGKKVLEFQEYISPTNIDVSQMSTGIYLVKMTNENNESLTQKLVITN